MAAQKLGVPRKSAQVLEHARRWPRPKFVAQHKSTVEGNGPIPTLATPFRGVVPEGEVRERPETGPLSIESSMYRSSDRQYPGDWPIEQ